MDATDPGYGHMRCRFEIVGGHVHCQMFGPYSGKAGDLVFRIEEWDHVRRTHPHWLFAAKDQQGPDPVPMAFDALGRASFDALGRFVESELSKRGLLIDPRIEVALPAALDLAVHARGEGL